MYKDNREDPKSRNITFQPSKAFTSPVFVITELQVPHLVINDVQATLLVITDVQVPLLVIADMQVPLAIKCVCRSSSAGPLPAF
jgi:hypothetical protein